MADLVDDKAACAKIDEIKDFFTEGQYFLKLEGPRNIVKVKARVSDSPNDHGTFSKNI